MLEQRIQELEEQMAKVLTWAKKKSEQIIALEDQLEAMANPKSNLSSIAWSKEEADYLMQEVKGFDPIRPRLLELEQEWEKQFDRTRSYEALRKKYNRLKDKSEYR